MTGGRFWETRVDTPKYNQDCPLHAIEITKDIIEALPAEADEQSWVDRLAAAEMDLAGHRTNEQIEEMKRDFIAGIASAQSSSRHAASGDVFGSQRESGQRGRGVGGRSGRGSGPGHRGGRGRGG